MHPLFRKSVCSLMAGLIGFTQTATTVAMAETVTPPYLNNRERQKFCVHGIIGARQTGASNEHEHQTQFS